MSRTGLAKKEYFFPYSRVEKGLGGYSFIVSFAFIFNLFSFKGQVKPLPSGL